ncbi:hypothetical protein M407DRAFT_32726 [Tulasnella calospora MUT 4182]|uniref:DUF7918 domain-containing protein n=1 Tax=Tulasnella calospora MUT 4182 TaxID=1051891 RepID=A0A0C3L7U9_9AGAM|nr:hypothetical protein M407DRAFT_32726 [Tulasnella calospora MUT 4182]
MPAEQEITELTFRGFSAQIRIGDRPLTIYKPDYDEETKTASGWIASEPGKEYFVCWKKHEITEYAANGRVSIDGPRTRSSLLARPPWTTWIVETGERVAKQKERPFVFSELSTTDDDSIIDKDIPTDPGTIKFEIHRRTITSDNTEYCTTSFDPFSTRLHEKTKKAGGHITKIGEERQTPSPRPAAQTKRFTDADIVPFVTFILRYRPEAILLASGFKPNPVQQSQGAADRNDEGSDEDEDEAQAEAEIAALEAARKARVASLAKRKGVKLEEVEAQLARKRRKVKQEEAIDVELHFTPGEVIDLTDL